MNVRLHNFCSFDLSSVCHRYRDCDLVRFGEHLAADRGCAIGEGRVGKTVAEGEERRKAQALVVTVANIQPFAVNDLQVLSWPIVVRWIVFKSPGECCLQKSLAWCE